MRLVATKFAAELCALDLGKGREFTFIKRYKYQGEDREKLTTYFSPVALSVSISGQISITAHGKPGSYWADTYYMKLDDKIAIFEPGEE